MDLISILKQKPSIDEAINRLILIFDEVCLSLNIPEMVPKGGPLSRIPKFRKKSFKWSCLLSNKLWRTSNL